MPDRLLGNQPCLSSAQAQWLANAQRTCSPPVPGRPATATAERCINHLERTLVPNATWTVPRAIPSALRTTHVDSAVPYFARQTFSNAHRYRKANAKVFRGSPANSAQ